MPPKRKAAAVSAAATRGAQSTLSFNNKKGAGARVTKPSATPTTTSKKLNEKLHSLEDTTESDVEVTVVAPPSKEADEFEAEEVEVKGVKAEVVTLPKKPEEKTKREVEAEKTSDATVKRYWKREEESRIAPRVHQQNLTINEKILRHFDLSSQYGPCIGVPRLKRWKRAEGLGLNPPVEVLAVLLKEEQADAERKKEEEGRWKRAYIDELLEGGSTVVE